MKHAAWMLGAVVLSLSGSALAAPAAGATDSATPVLSLESARTATPVVATAVDPVHKQAITSLHSERQAFVKSFDWTAGERQALNRQFNAAMVAFDMRELELKRDLYQATGQTDLLARTQAALDKRQQPARTLPEIGGERRAATQTATPEVTR
jgi:hypothetical protein